MTDRIFEALAHVSRRRLLGQLLEHGFPLSIHDEGDSPGSGATGVIELYHSHLPKLDDMGYIDWERESELVHQGPRFDEIRPMLALLRTNEEQLPEPWL